MKPAPTQSCPRDKACCSISQRKQVQPKRLGPWQVDVAIQSVALEGWDVLEKREDIEQIVAWGRSCAVGFTAWLVRASSF